MFDFNLLDLIAGIPGLIIAMVIHEYAHARVAVALGDRTPLLMGRLTLNPAAHIDPIGLIMLFLVRFGWAKPVIIDPRNFKKPRRDDILVSLAGPFANLVTAFLALVALLVIKSTMGHLSVGVYQVFQLIIIYNINFAIFNMIPLPPLDGSHVLIQLLRLRAARALQLPDPHRADHDACPQHDLHPAAAPYLAALRAHLDAVLLSGIAWTLQTRSIPSISRRSTARSSS